MNRSRRPWFDVFAAGFLCLFLELVLIRWVPAHVLYLTFFTNSILLASFLGITLGCWATGSRQRWLGWTALLVMLIMALALGIDSWQEELRTILAVGRAGDPQHVYFGTESGLDPARFVVPIELIAGLFFTLIALAMAGPGQEMGRALAAAPERAKAYSLSLLGSVAGIAAFSLCSVLHMRPVGWFALAAAATSYFLIKAEADARRRRLWLACVAAWVLAALPTSMGGERRLPLADGTPGPKVSLERFWSPYYRLDYLGAPIHMISANLLGHQSMLPKSSFYASALPYQLRKAAQGEPFEDVMIIGAGSGNDVARALEWNARRVDAVEIDPAIVALGRRDHPDRPYDDRRVSVHVDDGRNFLRGTEARYDLIVYALVDSLVLHSGYSNLRLESYLFTREAFADVKRRLKPGGVFVLYNFYRTGWIVSRIVKTLRETVGGDPVVLTLPFREQIEDGPQQGLSVILAGDVDGVRAAMKRLGPYWLPRPVAGSGFAPRPPKGEERSWLKLSPARVSVPQDLRAAGDDWPFLYLRSPMIPSVSLRGIAVMAFISLLLLWKFAPAAGARKEGAAALARMFLLGAGFMLIEAKAVVQLAQLFGSTWAVNSAVFLGVLTAALGASLLVQWVRPARLWPWHIAVLGSLLIGAAVPYEALLGLPRAVQVLGACSLAFSPVLFSGVLFTAYFERSRQPELAFGANAAGALAGGLAENLSMLLGFRLLLLVAAGVYLGAALLPAPPPAPKLPSA